MVEVKRSHTLLFEDMIRAETERYICRIWRQVDNYDTAGFSNDDLRIRAEAMLMDEGMTLYLQRIAEILVLERRVNSVEIIARSTGDGICVHKDWP